MTTKELLKKEIDELPENLLMDIQAYILKIKAFKDDDIRKEAQNKLLHISKTAIMHDVISPINETWDSQK